MQWAASQWQVDGLGPTVWHSSQQQHEQGEQEGQDVQTRRGPAEAGAEPQPMDAESLAEARDQDEVSPPGSLTLRSLASAANDPRGHRSSLASAHAAPRLTQPCLTPPARLPRPHAGRRPRRLDVASCDSCP